MLNAGTGAQIKKLFMPTAQAHWKMPASVSPDGHWLFCMVSDFVSPERVEKIALVDLEQGKLAALLPPMDSAVRCGAFSEDSAYLALGHQNGCVSIWKVAAMAEKPPADVQLADHAPEQRPARARARTIVGSIEPVKLKQGGTWTIDNQGSLTTDLSDMRIGEWYINGLPAVAHAQQLDRFDATEHDATRLDHDRITTELRDVSGNLRLQRTAYVDPRGQMSFIDQWENLSDASQDATLIFLCNLGVDPSLLRCEDGKPPEVRGREMIFGGGQNHISAVIPSDNDQPEQLLGITFGTASAPLHPVITWNFRQKILSSEWTLHLAPFQRRTICHDVLQQPRKGEQDTWIRPDEWRLRGIETLISAHVTTQLVNFAIEPSDRDFVEKFNKQAGLEPDGSMKDSLGFQWRNVASMEDVESGLGAERILSLWVNRQPLSFPHPRISKPGDPKLEPSPGVIEYSSSDTPLKVWRRTLFSPEQSCYITHDTFINSSAQPVDVPVDYLIVARSQIASVMGADGKPLDLTQPFPVRDCRGRLAVIFEGESKPALVLAAGDPHAALLPVLLYFPDSALFLHYDIKLNPGERISIANLAAPRSLTAFDKPLDAFAGLKAPMEFPRFQMKGIAAPANWR